MLFKFENRVPLRGRLSLPLMKSFNKTEAAIFPMKSMLHEDSVFLKIITTVNIIPYILNTTKIDTLLNCKYF